MTYTFQPELESCCCRAWDDGAIFSGGGVEKLISKSP